MAGAGVRAWRIGVTGGIGSGKSSVAKLLLERGAAVIDADEISRACTQAGGAAIPAIAQAFGPEFLRQDGALDRQRMRELAFKEPSARKTLEAIIHPLIGDEIERQVAQSTRTCVVFDVPLLVESTRWRRQLDRVLVVDCTPDTQVRRVAERSGWDLDATRSVMNSQSPRRQRLEAADLVIFNEGTLTDLETQVARIAPQFGL